MADVEKIVRVVLDNSKLEKRISDLEANVFYTFNRHYKVENFVKKYAKWNNVGLAGILLYMVGNYISDRERDKFEKRLQAENDIFNARITLLEMKLKDKGPEKEE